MEHSRLKEASQVNPGNTHAIQRLDSNQTRDSNQGIKPGCVSHRLETRQ